MEISDLQNLLDRWANLYDVKYSLFTTYPEESNADIFLKQKLIGAKDYKTANKLLEDIEAVDGEFRAECERRESEAEARKITDERNIKLSSTDWTMLADAPLSGDNKKLYRDYRQYLRDIPDLWKREQINELKVMTFEEWQDNKPVYKVERKY